MAEEEGGSPVGSTEGSRSQGAVARLLLANSHTMPDTASSVPEADSAEGERASASAPPCTPISTEANGGPPGSSEPCTNALSREEAGSPVDSSLNTSMETSLHSNLDTGTHSAMDSNLHSSMDSNLHSAAMSPESGDQAGTPEFSNYSRLYQCRLCNFSTPTFTHLQMHMPRHGSNMKALKCPTCDYCTSDKSNFRRHRRLHSRVNPTPLRCSKCKFMAPSPNKLRDHFASQHNEDCSPAMFSQMLCMNSDDDSQSLQTFSDSQYNRPVDLSRPQGQPVPIAPTVLASAPPPAIHFAQSQQTHYISCMPHFTPYDAQRRLAARDGHVASTFLRSMVSSNSGLHAGAPRVPATSTVTSSSFHPPSASSSTNLVGPLPGVSGSGEETASIKMEPMECDGHANNTSPLHQPPPPPPPPPPAQVTPVQFSPSAHSTELARRLEPRVCRRMSLERFEEPQRPALVEPGSDAPRTSVDQNGHTSVPRPERLPAPDGGRIIKSEMSTVGVQCEPKYEEALLPERRLRRGSMMERGVQCELLSSDRVSGSHLRRDSPTEGDGGQQVAVPPSKCQHCSVTFEDEVLFSIHIGCHSHTDPFTCNVCGKQCFNKYAFYSHIMRGHQF